jgi:hypothetical protein
MTQESKPRRGAAEVLWNHLELAREGSVDDDLAENFAPDVIVLTRWGSFHGHAGTKQLAERLARELPDMDFDYDAPSRARGGADGVQRLRPRRPRAHPGVGAPPDRGRARDHRRRDRPAPVVPRRRAPLAEGLPAGHLQLLRRRSRPSRSSHHRRRASPASPKRSTTAASAPRRPTNSPSPTPTSGSASGSSTSPRCCSSWPNG